MNFKVQCISAKRLQNKQKEEQRLWMILITEGSDEMKMGNKGEGKKRLVSKKKKWQRFEWLAGTLRWMELLKWERKQSEFPPPYLPSLVSFTLIFFNYYYYIIQNNLV